MVAIRPTVYAPMKNSRLTGFLAAAIMRIMKLKFAGAAQAQAFTMGRMMVMVMQGCLQQAAPEV